MFERMFNIISNNTFQKIQKTKVLLIGLGGVGGYAFEALIRSGFLYITIIDMDIFEETNLNRQILATQKTISKKKVLVAKERAEEINPNCHITEVFLKLTSQDISSEFLKKYDYIIDACDDVQVKTELLKCCAKNHIKIISSMGTANRMHPEELEITKLNQTLKDPLAKKLRRNLRDDSQALNLPVVCSKEDPKKSLSLGTIVTVPMVAGSLLTSYIINDIEKETTLK